MDALAVTLRISGHALVLVAGRVARAGAARAIAPDPAIGDLYLGAGEVRTPA
ncbi:hypothetical protein [Nocardia sp. IFM 10818]